MCSIHHIDEIMMDNSNNAAVGFAEGFYEKLA